MKCLLQFFIWSVHLRWVLGRRSNPDSSQELFPNYDTHEKITLAGHYHVSGGSKCYFPLDKNTITFKGIPSTRIACLHKKCYEERYCTHYTYVPFNSTNGICYLHTNHTINPIPYSPDSSPMKWNNSECGFLAHREGPYISWNLEDGIDITVNGIKFTEYPHHPPFQPLVITVEGFIPPTAENRIESEYRRENQKTCRRHCFENMQCTHYNWKNSSGENCVLMKGWVDETYLVPKFGEGLECAIIPIRRDWWVMQKFGVQDLIHPYHGPPYESAAPKIFAKINSSLFLCLLFSSAYIYQ